MRKRYKSGGYLASDVSKGASIGGQVGSVVPGIGTAVGTAVGAVTGATVSAGGALANKSKGYSRLVSGEGKLGKFGQAAAFGLNPWLYLGARRANKDNIEAEELAEQEKIQRQNFMDINSKGVLATYPTQGVSGIQSFKMGGKLEMVNDELGKFIGASHEQGGIKIPDGGQMSEVEGGETITDDGEIFSDSFNPSKDVLDQVSNLAGKKVKGTYANVSEALAEMAEDVEPMNRFEKKTQELMKPRSSQALDILFQDQERSKMLSSDITYKYGGKMKKYNKGGTSRAFPVSMQGRIDPDAPNPEFEEMYRQQQTAFRSDVGGNYTPNVFGITNTPFSTSDVIMNQGNIFKQEGYRTAGNPTSSATASTPASTPATSNVPVTQPYKKELTTPFKNDFMKRGVPQTDKFKDGNALIPATEIATREAVTPQSATLENRISRSGLGDIDMGSAMGQLANAANYINNKRKINELDTNVSPTFRPAARFNYIDRSNAQRADVDRIAGNTITSLRRSSPQGLDSATVGSIVSAQIQGRNQIADAEGRREDAARESFNARQGQVEAFNTGVSNEFEQLNTGLRNDKVSLELDASNAFTQGVIGNLQRSEVQKMDGAKALLIAIRQGDRETVNRTLKDYPELAKTIGL